MSERKMSAETDLVERLAKKARELRDKFGGPMVLGAADLLDEAARTLQSDLRTAREEMRIACDEIVGLLWADLVATDFNRKATMQAFDHRRAMIRSLPLSPESPSTSQQQSETTK